VTIFSLAASQQETGGRGVRQGRTLGAIKHPLYSLGGTTIVPALAVARRQREVISNSSHTSARYARRWWRRWNPLAGISQAEPGTPAKGHLADGMLLYL